VVDQIVDTCGETVGIDLHCRELRAQSWQAFAEALTQMLEASAVEMGGRVRHCRTANTKRNRGRSKIEQRQHDLQHSLKACPVVGELGAVGNLAVLEDHRRGGVGPQTKAVPGAGD
jgi:hypothetical protein